MTLIYQDRTEILKRMLFEVQNEVGLGRQEKAYHQACLLWLQEERIPFASKPPHRLMLGDDEAYVMYPDLVVWDSITVELKALPRRLGRGEVVQIFDYLKCRNERLGLLVNMGLDRVTDERFVYESPATQFGEDWTYWREAINGSDRELGIAVRDGLRFLYQAHGTGYGDEVFSRLILSALKRQGLNVSIRPTSKAYFRGIEVDQSPLDCLVVEDRLLIAYTALFDDLQFSAHRGLSYMRSLGLQWGLAVDFGKTKARMTGLRCRTNG
jgi:GxxExxY protein